MERRCFGCGKDVEGILRGRWTTSNNIKDAPMYCTKCWEKMPPDYISDLITDEDRDEIRKMWNQTFNKGKDI